MNNASLAIENIISAFYAKYNTKFHWCQIKENLISSLKKKNYSLTPLRAVKLASGDSQGRNIIAIAGGYTKECALRALHGRLGNFNQNARETA